ncbi:MAG: bifunctional riboflavin kinase/FAD synthetase [Actinobacteria bacterium]|nr:bifunctional riboflavin kinase/FAD synthetase [Actinomycetota bacterium]
MDVIYDLGDLAGRSCPRALTIGEYDGVHRGHKYVIAELCRRAEPLGLETVVLTFDRHPASVVRPESAPELLCDMDQKLELLAETGVDLTVVLTFDHKRAGEDARDFVEEVVVGALSARLVVVGENFHFGKNRSGDVPLLVEMGARLGFEAVGLSLDKKDTPALASLPASQASAELVGKRGADRSSARGGEPESPASAGSYMPVSSTLIRRLVSAGDVVGAAGLLGRLYEVRGAVEHGDGRGGRELGFPTANVAVPEGILLPREGIYAGWYLCSPPLGSDHLRAMRHVKPSTQLGKAMPAAISVGWRPTFYRAQSAKPRPLVEAYILGFDGDLYGQDARVRFACRLRDEKQFSAVEDLVIQMHQDVEETAKVLGI